MYNIARITDILMLDIFALKNTNIIIILLRYRYPGFLQRDHTGNVCKTLSNYKYYGDIYVCRSLSAVCIQ